LPLSYRDEFKYSKKKMHNHNEFVELLVARADNLEKVYPKIISEVPQNGFNGKKFGWFFDSTDWFGGTEFTLKRKQCVPSLQLLCKELVRFSEKEEIEIGDALLSAVVSKQVPLAKSHSPEESQQPPAGAAAAPPPPAATREGKQDVYDTISNFVRSCDETGIVYFLEVLHSVRRSHNNYTRFKTFNFSHDWSTHPQTSAINKTIHMALGGPTAIVQSAERGQMKWSCGELFSKSGNMSAIEKFNVDNKTQEVRNLWADFLVYLAPIVSENEYYHSISTKPIDRTLLTLKIEGVERCAGSYEEEKFKATATVLVPATMNFFQLHRVVMQTMNCSPDTRRETHEWTVPNIGSTFERNVTESDGSSCVQLGETYFVENGKRANYWDDVQSMFDRGGAVRQRLATTGAYCDVFLPLFYTEINSYSNNFDHLLGLEKIVACIHSTSIGSVFYQPGTAALLQDGLVKYMDKYKITCMKLDEYVGPLPRNELNVMQPKCLRGKPEPEEGNCCVFGWSVAKANEQLELDRGCLRRKDICEEGNILTKFPWCGNTFRRRQKRDLLSESSSHSIKGT
jgi:hypothetical protein